MQQAEEKSTNIGTCPALFPTPILPKGLNVGVPHLSHSHLSGTRQYEDCGRPPPGGDAHPLGRAASRQRLVLSPRPLRLRAAQPTEPVPQRPALPPRQEVLPVLLREEVPLQAASHPRHPRVSSSSQDRLRVVSAFLFHLGSRITP